MRLRIHLNAWGLHTKTNQNLLLEQTIYLLLFVYLYVWSNERKSLISWSFNSQSRQRVTFHYNINMRQMYCKTCNTIAQKEGHLFRLINTLHVKKIKSRVGPFPSDDSFMYCLCWFETSHFDLFTRTVISSHCKVLYDGRVSFNELLRRKFHWHLSVATDWCSFIRYAYQQCFHRSPCNNVITSVIATVANTVVMTAVWKTPPLHKPSSVMLFFLALTDLSVGLLLQPCYVTYLVSVLNKDPNIYDVISSLRSG